MQQKDRLYWFIPFLVSLSFIFCILNDNENMNVPENVSDFCLKDNDIPGWIRVEDSTCTQQDDSTLFDIINGGAGVYQERGLKSYIHQQLKNGENTSDGFVMNMGSADSAKSVMTYIRTLIADKQSDTLANLTQDILIEVYGVSTYVLYWAWENYYFELSFNGFTTDNVAKTEIYTFVDFFKSR